jgi:hypothetical protein
MQWKCPNCGHCHEDNTADKHYVAWVPHGKKKQCKRCGGIF